MTQGWQQVPLGEVILEREYLFHVKGDVRPVVLRVGKPVPHEDLAGDYVCPFEAFGFPKPEKTVLVGVDALQALISGLQVIGPWLKVTAKQYGGRLTWLDETGEDLGIPEFVRRPSL